MSDIETVTTKITIGSGGLTTLSGLLAYQNVIPILASIVGAAITLLSFCVMWRYKYLENKRAQELHDAKLLERRKGTGRRRDDIAAQICPLFNDCDYEDTQGDDEHEHR